MSAPGGAMSDPARQRLNSWKEISAHLKRDVRTVSRWEKERGLPVHRVPGGKGPSVFAYTDEVDAWLAAGRDVTPEGQNADESVAPEAPAAAPIPAVRRLAPRVAVTVALLAAIAFVAANVRDMSG